MNEILLYWLITGTLTLLLIYRLQRHHAIAAHLFKLRFSTTAQVAFLVIAFTTGFIIIPFIIIFTTIKHFKRWNTRRKKQWN